MPTTKTMNDEIFLPENAEIHIMNNIEVSLFFQLFSYKENKVETWQSLKNEIRSRIRSSSFTRPNTYIQQY